MVESKRIRKPPFPPDPEHKGILETCLLGFKALIVTCTLVLMASGNSDVLSLSITVALAFLRIIQTPVCGGGGGVMQRIDFGTEAKGDLAV